MVSDGGGSDGMDSFKLEMYHQAGTLIRREPSFGASMMDGMDDAPRRKYVG